jgi:hypothetical protein
MENNSSLILGIQDLIKELIQQNGMLTVDSTDQKKTLFEYSVEYNSLRILVMLKYAFGGVINSKTKFSFLDFLLRYPICLKYVVTKMHVKEEFSNAELNSLDKKMQKHITSAWDPDYYNYLGFLEARGLIAVNCKDRFEIKITSLGEKVISEFDGPEFQKLVRRSNLLKQLYGQKDETEIKEIIDKNFGFVKIC